MATSKTTQAVQRVRMGERVQEVARDLGITASAVYAQIKREADRERCPCCNQVLKDGYTVNADVLKKAPEKQPPPLPGG